MNGDLPPILNVGRRLIEAQLQGPDEHIGICTCECRLHGLYDPEKMSGHARPADLEVSDAHAGAFLSE